MSERAYVGVKPCGCPVAAVTFDPAAIDRLAVHEMSEMQKRGLSVREESVEWVREHLGRCKCKKFTEPRTRTYDSPDGQ